MADAENTTEQTAPQQNAPEVTPQSKAAQKKTAVAARPTPPETYQVTDKDTLESIAKQHNVSVAELQRRNAIKKPDQIWPGMNLTID